MILLQSAVLLGQRAERLRLLRALGLERLQLALRRAVRLEQLAVLGLQALQRLVALRGQRGHLLLRGVVVLLQSAVLLGQRAERLGLLRALGLERVQLALRRAVRLEQLAVLGLQALQRLVALRGKRRHLLLRRPFSLLCELELLSQMQNPFIGRRLLLEDAIELPIEKCVRLRMRVLFPLGFFQGAVALRCNALKLFLLLCETAECLVPCRLQLVGPGLGRLALRLQPAVLVLELAEDLLRLLSQLPLALLERHEPLPELLDLPLALADLRVRVIQARFERLLFQLRLAELHLCDAGVV